MLILPGLYLVFPLHILVMGLACCAHQLMLHGQPVLTLQLLKLVPPDTISMDLYAHPAMPCLLLGLNALAQQLQLANQDSTLTVAIVLTVPLSIPSGLPVSQIMSL